MKTSELYKYAQCAVIDAHLTNTTKLEILRVLFKDEDSALYWEKQAEKKEKSDSE